MEAAAAVHPLLEVGLPVCALLVLSRLRLYAGSGQGPEIAAKGFLSLSRTCREVKRSGTTNFGVPRRNGGMSKAGMLSDHNLWFSLRLNAGVCTGTGQTPAYNVLL